MIYFTSDTHFGDPRVLRIDRRPFANMLDQDAALISNWNSNVSMENEVWHLGDFQPGEQALPSTSCCSSMAASISLSATTIR
jgi:calcineurin-like phosphoesterase family protein